MSIQITNNGNFLTVVINKRPISVNKLSVRSLDVLRNDTLRIGLDTGPLHDLYIPYAEVFSPSTDVKSAFELLNLVRNMISVKGITPG